MEKHLVLVHRNLLWGESLASLLNFKEGFCVEKLMSYNELFSFNLKTSSLIVLEASYPNVELVNQIQFLKKGNHKIIVVGFIIDNQFVDLVVQCGVDAYVLKSDSKENLYLSVSQVCKGEKFFSARFTQILSERFTSDSTKLTQRELDVLIGIVNMHQSKQIADDLNISVATVRTHRKNIMRKVGAKNYLGLIKYACSNGLLESSGGQFCAFSQKIE